ncbi:class I SAM-dependent rRNA methyltransferase [bacterium]|nr:class I SAM-dependent rRNA methyltransferase [bacterium]
MEKRRDPKPPRPAGDQDRPRDVKPTRAPDYEPTQRDLSLPVELGKVFVRHPSFSPFVFRKRVDGVDGNPQPGDLVEIRLLDGTLIAHGLFNPLSEMLVRVLREGFDRPDNAYWKERLERAVSLRHDWLGLSAEDGACRLVHAEADGLSGLVVDRFANVLSIETFSLGMYERGIALAEMIAPLAKTTSWVINSGPRTAQQEGFDGTMLIQNGAPRSVEIKEAGTRFRVPFQGGHKTGFFCDQRDNRLKLAGLVKGKKVLDLCCYTGGFAIQAKRLGQAAEVTGVDLDEVPLELAKENGNLNQLRIQWVQADAFTYMRDMVRLGKRFDVVVVDPPKLITARTDYEEGKHKHFDLNRLALQLVEPGGLMLTCSCAGLLPESEFVDLVLSAARRTGPVSGIPNAPDGRRVQIIERTGASPDHPVADNCPENAYLKAVWMRVW